VNEARVGFSRSNMVQTPVEPLTAADVGMQPAVLDKPGMPQIRISGMFTIGPDPNNDQQVLIDTAQFSDTLSKIVGRHSLRMGGSVSPTRVTRHEVYVKRGTLSFLSFPDFLLGMSGAENGTPFSNISSTLVGNGREYAHPAFNNFAAFFQDDFRANDRLTLNLGLRYQYNGQQYLTDGVETNFDLSRTLATAPPPGGTLAGFTLPANVPDNVTIPEGVVKLDTKTLANTNNWLGFSPRIGMAWVPFDRWRNVVVHSGYGLFWSSVAGTIA
jgi:outer membrane receptor protein involved in Fe transport